MARYTKVLKSLAHNAVGNKRIESAAPAGNNYYVTGATLNTSNNVLSLARNGGLADVTVNLNSLAGGGGSIGGSITDNQIAVGASTANSIEGSANFTFDGANFNITGSSPKIIVDGGGSDDASIELRESASYGGRMYYDGDNNIFMKFTTIDAGTEKIRMAYDRDGNVYLGSADASDATPNPNMYIAQAGNVGIGTTSPDTKLHVEGNTAGSFITVEGTETDSSAGIYTGLHIKRYFPRIRLEDTSNNSNMYIWALGSQMRFGSSAGSSSTSAMFVQSGSANNTVTNTASVQINNMLKIGANDPLNSGRLSIIDTTRPLVLGYDTSNYVNFEVSSSGDFTIDAKDDIRLDAGGGDIVLRDDGSEYGRLSNSSQNLIINQTQNDKDIIFQVYDNSITTEVMRIDGSVSRVGIGTSSPDQKLHVKSADNYLAKFESTDGIAEIRLQDNAKYTRLLSVGSQLKLMPDDGAEMMNLDGSAYKTTLLGETGGNSPKLVFDNPDASNDIQLTQGDAGWFGLSSDGGSTQHFVLRTGNIGIGTESPDSMLEISTAAATDHLKLTSGGGTANPIKLIFEKSSVEQGIIEYNRNGDLELYNSDADGGVMIDGSTSGGGDLYVSNAGNVGIGTTSPSTKLNVSGGSTTFDNGSSHSVFFKNAGSQYGAIDTYGTSLSIEANNEAILSGASGVLLKGGNYGVLLSPIGTNAGDTSRLRFRELAANGTATVSVKAPDSIASDIQLILPASAGTANQVLAIDSVSSGVMTLGFQTNGSMGGSVSANYIPYASSADTLADFAPAYTEGTNIIIGVTADDITTDADNNTSLGNGALYKITDGDKNVAIGYYAARSGTTANNNVAIGSEAHRLGITGNYNVSIGQQANYSGAKDANVVIGYQAAVSAGNQSGSVSIGYRAARYPQGNYNTAIGMQALQGNSSVTSAYNNTAVGYQAGHDITSGYRNTLVGFQAGYDIESGLDNTLIGQQAGANITTGPRNTIVGSYAGDALTTVDGVVAIGYAALGAGAGSSYDVAIGYQAHNNGTGRGVFIGLQAGAATTGGGVHIGSEAGETNTVGSLTLIGSEAGKMVSGTATGMTAIGHGVSTNASGTYHTMVGFQAGNTLKGNVNTGIGYKVLRSGTNATHQNNIAIGYQTMQGGDYSVTNQDNVAIGINAMRYASGSSYNVAVGQTLFATDQTSTQVVSIGYRALSGTTSTTGTTAIGHLAGRDLTVGDFNTVIGKSAMLQNTQGEENTIIGYDAGYNVQSASSLQGSFNTFLGFRAAYNYVGGVDYGSNVAIGHQTLLTGTNANRTVAVGNAAGVSGTASTDNVLVGYGAGSYANSTGNTMIGNKAGFRTNGNYNTAVGYRTLSGSSSGDTSHNNVAIGYTAMEDATSANENVIIGNFAAAEITTGDYNTAIGYAALRYGETTNRQVAVGYAALSNFTQSGDLRNVAVGMYAMLYPRSGSNNIAMGYGAMRGANSTYDSDYNVALGSDTLYAMEGGDANTAVGYQAGYNITTGGDNVLVGRQAGNAMTTQGSATLVGYKAGFGNTVANIVAIGKNSAYSNTGGNIVAVGYEALFDNTTGTEGLAVGYQASRNNTVAHQNVALGHQTLYDNESGSKNIAIGYRAMYEYAPASAVDGNNVAVGYQALYDQTTATSNIGIGHQAGQNVTTGGYSVYIGDNAGRTITDAGANVMIGYQAGYPLGSSASSNVIIGGNAAVAAEASTNSSTIVGQEAGYSAGGTASVAIGKRALYFPHGNYNVAIGEQALYGNSSTTTAQQNVAIGRQALYSATSAHTNVAVGYLAGNAVTTGERNVILGHEAARYANTMNYSTVIGNNAGTMLSGASSVVIIGRNAGYYVTGNNNTFVGTNASLGGASLGHAGEDSVAVGYNAMYYNSTANYNVAVGTSALQGDSGGLTGDNNVAIGRQSLFSVSSAGSNVAIGMLAGYSQTTGDDNVYIGTSAGKASTTAAGNVAIGKDAMKIGAQTSSNGGQNSVVGYGAYVDGTGQRNAILGYRAAYTSTSANSNVAIGYEAGQKNTTGDSNVFIGNKAGPSSTSTDSNKLYIHNNEGTPLIGGDFSADTVDINGDLSTLDSHKLKVVNASSNYWAIYNQSNGKMRIDQGTTQRVLASSGEFQFANDIIVDGNIGIGGTPSTRLHITGSGDQRITLGSSSSNSSKLVLASDGGADRIDFSLDGVGNMLCMTETGRIGMGTTNPATKVHISGAATQELRINSSDSNAYSRVQLRSATDGYAQFNMGDTGADAAGGLVYTHSTDTLNIRANNSNIVNVDSSGIHVDGNVRVDNGHTIDFDSRGYIDVNQDGGTGEDKFHIRRRGASDEIIIDTSTTSAPIIDSPNGTLNLQAASNPVVQLKDDTGFIMQDNMGVKSASANLANWPLDGGTGKATATVQGFSKIQNIVTAGVDPASVPSFEVKLPSASVGAEYIIVFGSNQANLTGKALTLIADGSDVIHSGSSTPSSITFAKHTGESIHLIAFESDRWKVLSHT